MTTEIPRDQRKRPPENPPTAAYADARMSVDRLTVRELREAVVACYAETTGNLPPFGLSNMRKPELVELAARLTAKLSDVVRVLDSCYETGKHEPHPIDTPNGRRYNCSGEGTSSRDPYPARRGRTFINTHITCPACLLTGERTGNGDPHTLSVIPDIQRASSEPSALFCLKHGYDIRPSGLGDTVLQQSDLPVWVPILEDPATWTTQMRHRAPAAYERLVERWDNRLYAPTGVPNCPKLNGRSVTNTHVPCPVCAHAGHLTAGQYTPTLNRLPDSQRKPSEPDMPFCEVHGYDLIVRKSGGDPSRCVHGEVLGVHCYTEQPEAGTILVCKCPGSYLELRRRHKLDCEFALDTNAVLPSAVSGESA